MKLSLAEESSFHEVDNSLLFKKVYFNTKYEGNEILIKWFDFLKQSVFINVYSRSIVTYNEEPLTLLHYLEKYGVEDINRFFKNK